MRVEHVTKYAVAQAPRGAIAFALVLALGACGGSTPPPAPPSEPQASAASSATPAAPSETLKTPEAEPAPPAAAEKPSDTTLEKPTRPVKQILEAADTVFFVNYEESDPGKAGEAQCAKESGGDPQKNAACMSKARQALEGLGYRFKKAAKGDVTTCTILKRSGNNLTTQHKFKYKYGEETDTSVVIKMDGKDDGPVKWEKIPAEFKVEIPNDYQIVMRDPKYGRLVYYAKVGIPGD
ncbi:MAG: hypothetical protein ABW133_04215 [Polyangiaceae bacterium]